MARLGKAPWIWVWLATLVLWQLSAARGWIGRTLIASPVEVLERLRSALSADPTSNDAIFSHALETAARALGGWSISLALGLPLGMILGRRLRAYVATEPSFELARAIPPILAFPILLVAFDYGQWAYLWTIVFGCLPIVTLTTARGVRSIDPMRLEVLKVHQPSRTIRVAVGAMETLPAAFLGARLTFSMSLIVAVVTEMVFTPPSGFGIGGLAKDSEISFDTPTFYACVLLVGMYGYATNVLLRLIETKLGAAPSSRSEAR